MKTLQLLCICLCVMITIYACKIDESLPVPSRPSQTMSYSLDDAREWFVQNVEAKARMNGSDDSLTKSPQWHFGVKRSTSEVGDVIVVPVKYENGTPVVAISEERASKKKPGLDMNLVTRLVIWKDAEGQFQYRLHHIIPTENYFKKNRSQFKRDLSGTVLVTDFEGKLLEAVKMENGRQVAKFGPAGKSGRTSSCINYVVDWYTRVCVNNECYEPRWTHMEIMTACWEGDHGSDGYTPPPTVSSPQTVTNTYDSNGQYVYQTSSGDQTIDVFNEIECFGVNSNPNSIFLVKIYVDQPIPGFRSINLNASNGSSPGHVYIGLEEYSNGQALVRNIGMYPKNGANPLQPQDQSRINRDDRYYDVSLTIQVNQNQFAAIVSNLVSSSSTDYNLNDHNCTTYVCNAFNGTSINIPRTNGTWFFGGGLNPSDLGEDIRSMTLSSNMTRNTSGGYPSARQGGCN